jgi:hypothetical protein
VAFKGIARIFQWWWWWWWWWGWAESQNFAYKLMLNPFKAVFTDYHRVFGIEE